MDLIDLHDSFSRDITRTGERIFTNFVSNDAIFEKLEPSGMMILSDHQFLGSWGNEYFGTQIPIDDMSRTNEWILTYLVTIDAVFPKSKPPEIEMQTVH